MKDLNISLGLEEYRLNGKVTVRFNPTDAGFLEKLAETYEKLDALQEQVAKSRENIKSEKELFPFAKELDGKMRFILDCLFDVPVCEELFGAMNLFSSAGGLPVWANLMLAVTEEVESALQGEMEKREARIAKYTEKYKVQSEKFKV